MLAKIGSFSLKVASQSHLHNYLGWCANPCRARFVLIPIKLDTTKAKSPMAVKFTFESQTEIYYMLKALNQTQWCVENGLLEMDRKSLKGFQTLRKKFADFALANP
ncbi:Hypothetical protein P9303_27621 [Prochlorococcus marinus str. MIT 9303]|nr:Hypothetical protein P9303_27621 [Prochlorococcus marinus str. MIT 9303]